MLSIVSEASSLLLNIHTHVFLPTPWFCVQWQSAQLQGVEKDESYSWQSCPSISQSCWQLWLDTWPSVGSWHMRRPWCLKFCETLTSLLKMDLCDWYWPSPLPSSSFQCHYPVCHYISNVVTVSMIGMPEITETLNLTLVSHWTNSSNHLPQNSCHMRKETHYALSYFNWFLSLASKGKKERKRGRKKKYSWQICIYYSSG